MNENICLQHCPNQYYMLVFNKLITVPDAKACLFIVIDFRCLRQRVVYISVFIRAHR